jgi:formate-dependent nitrite reductase membrane component NrfD
MTTETTRLAGHRTGARLAGGQHGGAQDATGRSIAERDAREPRESRDALADVALLGSAGYPRGRRRREREQPMVPAATFDSYYGRPIIKEPTWQAADIAGYFFLGGLAGASSLLAAGSQLTGRHRLARAAKTGALAGIGLSTVALVHDLGRPSRFGNMLRVIKPTSPMSIGSWLLAWYGPAAGVAAVTDWLGRFRPLGQAATAGAAILGAGVATYTAVLIADTAVPAWHEGYRELPFLFVGSAATAAGGLGMLTAPVAEAGPARRAAAFGAVVELAARGRMTRRLGMVAAAYQQGKAKRLLRVADALTLTGTASGLLLGHRSRRVAAVSGLALLTASACTRFGVFAAGRASARDPKYTVTPQRDRLVSRSQTSADVGDRRR